MPRSTLTGRDSLISKRHKTQENSVVHWRRHRHRFLHRPQQGEQAHSEKIEENELDRERKEARVSECPHRGPGAIGNIN